MTKNTENAVKPVVLLSGAAAINKAIDSIASRGKKLDRDIQQAAISAMAHHSEHGDVTLVNRLVDNMPKGSRVNALRDYIQHFGACGYDEASKAFVHAKGKAFDLEGAQGRVWTDFKPEPEYQPFDAAAAIAKIVKKLDSASEDRPVKALTPEQDRAIRELAQKFAQAE